MKAAAAVCELTKLPLPDKRCGGGGLKIVHRRNWGLKKKAEQG